MAKTINDKEKKALEEIVEAAAAFRDIGSDVILEIANKMSAFDKLGYKLVKK